MSTNKQTNQRYQKHNLLCQGGKNKSTQRAQSSLMRQILTPILLGFGESANFDSEIQQGDIYVLKVI